MAPVKSVKRSHSSSPSPSPKAKKPHGGKTDREIWTKEDVVKLYNLINPRPTKTDWKMIETEMGKGSNACRMKWRGMEAKIQSTVAAMGE
ncbi:hypothetical protein M231_03996 [Tremella mesenterica]|uniref:Myb-like domain-containing protein n=1 Tax=Tremella mesenterica TaxID=5217 RepID=A0A4Q1BLN8_TREME|nr:hypothetical protein M231_03996 [Tremella mesenterica]